MLGRLLGDKPPRQVKATGEGRLRHPPLPRAHADHRRRRERPGQLPRLAHRQHARRGDDRGALVRARRRDRRAVLARRQQAHIAKPTPLTARRQLRRRSGAGKPGARPAGLLARPPLRDRRRGRPGDDSAPPGFVEKPMPEREEETLRRRPAAEASPHLLQPGQPHALHLGPGRLARLRQARRPPRRSSPGSARRRGRSKCPAAPRRSTSATTRDYAKCPKRKPPLAVTAWVKFGEDTVVVNAAVRRRTRSNRDSPCGLLRGDGSVSGCSADAAACGPPRARAASRPRSPRSRSGFRRPARPLLRARLSSPGRCPRSRR